MGMSEGTSRAPSRSEERREGWRSNPSDPFSPLLMARKSSYNSNNFQHVHLRREGSLRGRTKSLFRQRRSLIRQQQFGESASFSSAARRSLTPRHYDAHPAAN